MNKTDLSIIRILAMGNLLESYSTIQAELRYVNECNLNNQLKISDADAVKSLMKELNINDFEILKNWQKVTLLSTDEKLLIEYAHFRFKRRCIIEELIESNSEALFLRYKDRLDRVLYSILRVSEQNLAYHLYYSIDSGEISFGEAATKYSEGPESKTQGILGPCDLTVPHPDVSSRLRTAEPKKIFKPFPIDNWFIILRLEYRFDSELNESTKQILGKMLLNSKIRPVSEKINKETLQLFVKE
mgnify:CR=1 FL=1